LKWPELVVMKGILTIKDIYIYILKLFIYKNILTIRLVVIVNIKLFRLVAESCHGSMSGAPSSARWRHFAWTRARVRRCYWAR
jgi:hypothetical protein